MPKQKTDDLIRLIQSLSRAEKRHFRLFVKRNQASDDILFLQLFDFLDKHQEYDEEKILKKLPAIKKRQLSNLKAHLYKQLLISLRLLNKNHDLNIELRESMDYARVLYNKGLYRQALDILDKTKNKALQTKRNTIALEMLEFEKHIEGQYITRSIENRAEELSQEATELSRIIQRANKFTNLALQLYGLYLKQGFVRNESDYLRVKAYFANKLPAYKPEELGFFERVYLYQSYVWYHHITQDFPYCYRYAQKWVDEFHKEPEMIKIEVPLYLKGLHNLLSTCFNMWNYDRFMESLKKLDDLKKQMRSSKITNVKGLYHLFWYIHQINRHYMEGTFSEGVELIPDLMKIIEQNKYNWDDHRIMVFYYKIACLYFGSGDNEQAIDYLNRIINQKNPDYRQDIQAFARILNLIAHFELGNERLVEYQVKSVYRFLSKMKDLQQVQREIFRFLRKTPRMHASELKKEFIKLKDKLKAIRQEPYEMRPFLYLDIISWLESKIEDRTVQDIVRAKFLAQQTPV